MAIYRGTVVESMHGGCLWRVDLPDAPRHLQTLWLRALDFDTRPPRVGMVVEVCYVTGPTFGLYQAKEITS
jgi:hypothetical protein